MINIEKNEENFKKIYEYYKERIESVTYPIWEIDKICVQDKITKEKLIKQQRIKMLKQKYEHTKRVVEMIKKMNDIMNNKEFFKELSVIAGLLHDYGRRKDQNFNHVIEGFQSLVDLNLNNEAIVCLTHSFLNGGRCCNNEPAINGFYVDEEGNPKSQCTLLPDDLELVEN